MQIGQKLPAVCDAVPVPFASISRRPQGGLTPSLCRTGAGDALIDRRARQAVGLRNYCLLQTMNNRQKSILILIRVEGRVAGGAHGAPTCADTSVRVADEPKLPEWQRVTPDPSERPTAVHYR